MRKPRLKTQHQSVAVIISSASVLLAFMRLFRLNLLICHFCSVFML